MSPEAQRIAIAEACGWEDISAPYSNEREWTGIRRNGPFRESLPDYLADLNAMHEAWLTLTGDQKVNYFDQLMQVHARDLHAGEVDPYVMIHADAAQRAEAFLRTIGKWGDKQ